MQRRGAVVVVLLFVGACIGPFRCESETTTRPISHDFAVEVPDTAMPPCSGMCNGVCVDLRTDPNNCGSCGIVCPSGVCQPNDAGVAYCTCNPEDGGAPSCGAAVEPTCTADTTGGHCTCGGQETQICSPQYANGCTDGGFCVCGTEGECDSKYANECDTTQTPPSCRCGSGPSCDPDKSDNCDPSSSPSCRCGTNPACTGGDSCCEFDVTGANCCGGTNHYCCLDGCCPSPCLFFGFCSH